MKYSLQALVESHCRIPLHLTNEIFKGGISGDTSYTEYLAGKE